MDIFTAQKTRKLADCLQVAKDVLHIESQAIENLMAGVDDNFLKAVSMIFNCKSHVVVSGMGKSGHIGKKIAATFASTGTPSFFMHPAEALHGDLGMLTTTSVVLAISYSGENAELLKILLHCKQHKIATIILSGNSKSQLALLADIYLSTRVEKEACCFGLAPTASTTASLALGDALAVSVSYLRGFSVANFLHSHPAGALGSKNMTQVESIKRSAAEISVVQTGTLLTEVLNIAAQKSFDFVAVVGKDTNKKLIGMFMVHELWRIIQQQVDIEKLVIDDVMHTEFPIIKNTAFAFEAIELMNNRQVANLPVVDGDNNFIGFCNIHDLFGLSNI